MRGWSFELIDADISAITVVLAAAPPSVNGNQTANPTSVFREKRPSMIPFKQTQA
ncbi:hypothetical protein PENANT_c007G07000 [Penicillium antarcticum]|uniref:Uncharacterized protein n=1 Tax=Penicillium antarcticum TaxID=416450 RepID=A0A1V6QCV5_9EURO|nr:hypothetical protein PENANT_c007G07000 [Penicillium antarcticum]